MVYCRGSLVTQMVKSLCVVQETQGRFPELGRSPGEGNGNPLQNSCLENPTDGRAWRATQSIVYFRPHISWSRFPGIHNCIAYFLLGTCGPGLVLLFWLLFCSSLCCGRKWVCLILSPILWALWGWGSHSVWLIVFDPWLISRNYCFWTGSG